jgi:hypothetical protein
MIQREAIHYGSLSGVWTKALTTFVPEEISKVICIE